jgi:hypothetical protein
MAYVNFDAGKNNADPNLPHEDCYEPKCQYRRVDNKCAFETCIFKEFPPAPRTILQKCIVCGAVHETTVEKCKTHICHDCIKGIRSLLNIVPNNWDDGDYYE